MDERFIPLAAFVRSLGTVAPAAPQPAPVPGAPSPPCDESRDVRDFAHADIVHELTLMRLAAFEAFERAKATLLDALATQVLGRELALAPADVEALATSTLELFCELEPVSIAVSALDAERVRTPLPVRIDASLGAGDFVVDVRDGTLASHFTFRLQGALERARASA